MPVETSPPKTPASQPPAPPVTPESLASLQAENAALQKQISDLTAAKKINEAEEKIIAQKTSRGLSRAQAIAVIRRQKEYDNSSMAKARAEFAKNPKGPSTLTIYTRLETERAKAAQAA